MNIISFDGLTLLPGYGENGIEVSDWGKMKILERRVNTIITLSNLVPLPTLARVRNYH